MHRVDEWWKLPEITRYLNLDTTQQRIRQVSSRLQQHGILIKPERSMIDMKLDQMRSFSTLNMHVFDAYYYMVRTGRIGQHSRNWHKSSPEREMLIQVQQTGWWWSVPTCDGGYLPAREEVTLINDPEERERCEEEGR